MTTETCIFYTTLSQYHPELIQRIPTAERQRAEKKSTLRQQLFVLGRALLVDSLRFLGGIEQHADYTLYYSSHGKPILCLPDDWQFNLTHSGKHLFLALRRHHAIGIDSEVLRPRAYQGVAKKLFTLQEQQTLANAIDPMPVFYRLWTQYEAQVKYLGLSVFSDLPDTPQRYVKSYRYQQLVSSLCSEEPLSNVLFYRCGDNNNDFIPFCPEPF